MTAQPSEHDQKIMNFSAIVSRQIHSALENNMSVFEVLGVLDVIKTELVLSMTRTIDETSLQNEEKN